MSEIKVNSIKGVGASAAAITVNNTDGTCTANITSNGGAQLSNRNKIHNGSFKINQRSASASANNGFPCDRWKIKTISNGDGKGTYAQYAMTAAELNLTGQAYALKFDCTTAITSLGTSDGNRIQQSIEGQDLQDLMHGTSNAKSATLSFWVKSNVVGTYSIFMMSANTTATQYQIQEYTINAQNTWEKKTVTFTPFTTSMMVNTTSAGTALGFNLALGTDYHGTAGSWTTGVDLATSNQPNVLSSTDNNWYITGVQFEVGSVATDFEHRSFGQELALCKRYYNRFTAGSAYTRFADGQVQSTDQAEFTFQHPVTMRAAPTFGSGGALKGWSENALKTVSSLALNDPNVNNCTFTATTSGCTRGTAIDFIANNDATAYIEFISEL